MDTFRGRLVRLLIVAAAVMLLATFCAVFCANFYREVEVVDVAFRLVRVILGTFAAVIALAEILWETLRDCRTGRVLAWALVLLSGLLVAYPNWAVAVGLAAVAAAIVVHGVLGGGAPRGKTDET